MVHLEGDIGFDMKMPYSLSGASSVLATAHGVCLLQ